MHNWSEGQVLSQELKIHYHRTGSGDKPVIILAHGFTDNGLCWVRTARTLEDRYDLVMVDARNHGQSDQGSASQAELAGDLANVITELQLAPVIAMGHSVGASVVTTLAVDYPELVTALILEDPPWKAPYKAASNSPKRLASFHDYVSANREQTIEQITQAGMTQHPSWHADEFPPWALSNQQVNEGAMERLVLGDWNPLVPKLQCPTLLIYGDEDRDGIVSQDTAVAIGGLNSLVQTRQVNGAGHNLRRESFAGFLEAVTDFLMRVGV